MYSAAYKTLIFHKNINIPKTRQMESIHNGISPKEYYVARNMSFKNKMTEYSVIFLLKKGVTIRNSKVCDL